MKVGKAGNITHISFMFLQDMMLRTEAKFNFTTSPEKLCFCLGGGDFSVHLKLYADLTNGEEAMLIMMFFSRLIQHEYTQTNNGAK